MSSKTIEKLDALADLLARECPLPDLFRAVRETEGQPMIRLPQIGDRVHWATGVGAGLSGRIVTLQGLPEQFGTMVVEWDGGQCSQHLPQSLMQRDPRWSYEAS